MMIRCLGLLVLAAAALAEERPVSDLQILKWQVEAQARERSLARRLDLQGESARTAPNRAVDASSGPTQRRTAVIVEPAPARSTQDPAVSGSSI